MKNLIKRHQELILFVVFGILTTLVNWVSYAAMVAVNININISNILAWVIAVIFAYVVNKFFVFKNKDKEFKKIFKDFLLFVSFRLFAGLIEILGLPFLIHIGLNQYIFGVEGFFAKVIVSFVSFVANYVGGKLIWNNKNKE